MAIRKQRLATALSVIALLAGCSSGGGPTATSGGSTSSTASAPSPSPSQSPTSGTCTLRARQDWALAQLREWYLFPETLPASLDPAPFTTVSDYIDALTATARSPSARRYSH